MAAAIRTRTVFFESVLVHLAPRFLTLVKIQFAFDFENQYEKKVSRMMG